MSDPLLTPDDLGLYLGDSTINTDRAIALIARAQTLCESIVSPLPPAAAVVVERVAGRAYVTITSARQMQIAAANGAIGSSPGGMGGVWLSRGDKADLRRLSGGSAAFSIDTLPTGVTAQQQIMLSGAPTGGTFTVGFVSQFSAPIPITADGPAMQSYLQAIPSIGQGNVLVSGAAGGPWLVTGAGDLTTTPMPTLTTDSTGLTGGTNPEALVTVIKVGVLAPGQALPPWDATNYGAGGFMPGGFE